MTIGGKHIEMREVQYPREGLERLLGMCREDGFREGYMPQLIDGLIEAPDPARFIGKTVYTFSLKICGNVPGAQAYDIYAHAPTYFTDPENMRNPTTVLSRSNDPERWDREHARVVERQRELRKLYNQVDDKTVFRIGSFDYRYVLLRNEIVTPQLAAEMRLTESIFGDRQRAERFFSRYSIRDVFARHADDVTSSDSVEVGFLRIVIGEGHCRYEAIRHYELATNDVFVTMRDVA